VRDVEDRTKEDGQSPAPQRLLVSDPET
jgi:hypothetical protein